MNPGRFGLDPDFVGAELHRLRIVLDHYRDLYNRSSIKNIMVHRLISLKEQELKHLEFIQRAYDREPHS